MKDAITLINALVLLHSALGANGIAEVDRGDDDQN